MIIIITFSLITPRYICCFFFESNEIDLTLSPDLTEYLFSDYVAAPELDVYEKEHLDDRVFDESYLENLRNRQLADEEIEARLEAQRRAREKDDFAREGAEGIDDTERQEAEEDSDEDYFDDEDDDDEDGEDGERERRLNLDAFDCPLTEWIDEARTRREIESRFRRFLNTYYEGIENVTQWRRENEGKEELICEIALTHASTRSIKKRSVPCAGPTSPL